MLLCVLLYCQTSFEIETYIFRDCTSSLLLYVFDFRQMPPVDLMELASSECNGLIWSAGENSMDWFNYVRCLSSCCPNQTFKLPMQYKLNYEC
jgi:hypothetical protein